jgi:fructosamine-3-kinase
LLVLEHLQLRPRGDWAAFGTALAALHRHGAGTFGWHRDNTIGATPQPNRPNSDWLAFFHEQRLGHPFRIAASNGYRSLADSANRLLERTPAFFPGYRLRKPLYNLYHQLNHLNLFGTSYLAACEEAIARLLARTG